MQALPTIPLDRLLLRPFCLDDAKAVQELAGDPYIADMTLYIPHPYDDGIAEKWIASHQDQFEQGRSLELAIVHKEGQYVVGAICIAFHPPFDHGELAYWVGKPYSNLGYCTEAAKGIVRYAFEEIRLNRVFARHFGRNPASGKVMAKVGMKYEGTLRQHAKKQGKYEDLVYYGLLKEEYLSMK